uniref:Uncharacterized protein n=1 Tax=Aegilops tauschii subsp. strangulata TaxID=200361 RepID=A0A453LV71_AEGTS
MFWPTNGLSSLPYVNAFVSFMSSAGADLFPRSKEKDDTEDGEYEMVWDAEGSMHLVKKAVARPPITNADSKTTGRYVCIFVLGNAFRYFVEQKLAWCFYK